MATTDLRPMGIGDILDATFRLYRQNFTTFLLIVLLAYVPYALLFATFGLAVPGEMEPVAPGEMPSVAPAIVFFAMSLVFAFVVIPLCQGALVHHISASYLGEQLGAAASYRRALPRLVRLLIAWLMAGVIIVIGFVLLIVPGIIFSLWFMVITPVVMLETTSPSGSLGRSRELMRDNLGKGFLIGLVVVLLGFVFQFVVEMAMAAVPWPSEWLALFVTTLLPALILPIQIAPYVLLYYDLRIRKEGLDLELLAEAIGSAPPEGGMEPQGA